MSDKANWEKPNRILMAFECTRADYANNFVLKGEIKFNTPQSWVDTPILKA